MLSTCFHASFDGRSHKSASCSIISANPWAGGPFAALWTENRIPEAHMANARARDMVPRDRWCCIWAGGISSLSCAVARVQNMCSKWHTRSMSNAGRLVDMGLRRQSKSSKPGRHVRGSGTSSSSPSVDSASSLSSSPASSSSPTASPSSSPPPISSTLLSASSTTTS